MILVTGINGFVGKHLTRELAGQNIEVMGVGNNEPMADPEIADLLNDYRQVDITNKNEVAALDLRKIDAIINLAGLANVGASFANPELYMNVNVNVLLVLGEELLRQNPKARMLAVSTGAVYDSSQEMPLSEDSTIVENGSPYAMSKIAMEGIGAELRQKGLDCVIARPFNHIGPGQGLGFLIPDMITKLETARKTNTITVGNIQTSRDYTDVRDIVKAYANLATSKEIIDENVFNVCSGVSIKGEEIIKKLCKIMVINFSNLTIDVDRSLVRPSDPMQIYGDCSRLREATGWRPTINLDQTLKDIYDQYT